MFTVRQRFVKKEERKRYSISSVYFSVKFLYYAADGIYISVLLFNYRLKCCCGNKK